MEYNSILIFIISAFCLGAVLIMMRNSVPQKLKRGLAGTAAFMILIAFILIVYSLFKMGSSP
ncbi:hypothetical protein PAJ34TS1_48350 [Paenibacillus azoreducens]|uniref:Signal transduction histidine kinase n=1 Tax=Paenibacillus azoreducens TaxID=116718 RepID=A0A919YGQ9_9BACL|nr:hypothetical protein [Paenibacillus azoreducens]GIO49008.1 hypothetical protein J34TS1_37730 [Paenibacillus azoreducens]